MSKKIVVAYSGGLDTSVLLLWLKKRFNAEIIAYFSYVGQGLLLHFLLYFALHTVASQFFLSDLPDDFPVVFCQKKKFSLYKKNHQFPQLLSEVFPIPRNTTKSKKKLTKGFN